MAHNFITAFARLPETWRALSVLGGAVALGVAIALAASTFIGLPGQVQENTEMIRQTSRSLESHVYTDDQRDRAISVKIDRILCLLTLPEDTRPVDAQVACP